MDSVLLFTPIYPPYRGGGPNYYSSLINDLSEDIEIVVLTATHPEKPLRTTESGAIVYRALPRVRFFPRVVRALYEPLFAFILTLLLIFYHRIDLVHSHSTSIFAVGVGFATATTSRPIVYDCRDEEFPRFLVRIGRTPVWFSCAQNIEDRLVSAGIPRPRIIHTPVVNPPLVSVTQHNPTTCAEHSLVFVGALRKEKGVFLTIDAFAEHIERFPSARLRIVGAGPERDAIEDRLRRLALTEHVTLTGEVNHPEAVNHIANADVLLLPSASEGMPRVVIEAMSVGTPVLATRVGAIDEILSHGVNGLFIDDSTTSLLDALNRVFSDEVLLETITTGAEETTSDVEWGDVVASVQEGYDRALTDPKK
ncbi:glycosyltransferase family 4 protein [Haladaptatus sp. ZSTT2]|uniref:glycosyltransferase family 4 protein n=1 Tax=Haladaptatus sp. ZSTT2 TaxID=3120515 RepID=UPI00300ED545